MRGRIVRIRRRNTVWLGLLTALVGVAVLSGTADNPAVVLVLIALLAVAFAGTLLDMPPRQMMQQANTQVETRRMSAEAREASERVRRRGIDPPNGIHIRDIGMIAMERGDDGIVLRRARSVSKDEDGVRPFITLNVGAGAAERQSVVRFEMMDQNGDTQYVHEMKMYLREGEMNILADHHLPLGGNDRLSGAGDWDLRAYLNGTMIGIHTFSVMPSLRDRFPHLREDEAEDTRRARASSAARPSTQPPERRESTVRSQSQRASSRLSEPDRRIIDVDDAPMSLEDLLRNSNSGNDRSER